MPKFKNKKTKNNKLCYLVLRKIFITRELNNPSRAEKKKEFIM